MELQISTSNNKLKNSLFTKLFQAGPIKSALILLVKLRFNKHMIHRF